MREINNGALCVFQSREEKKKFKALQKEVNKMAKMMADEEENDDDDDEKESKGADKAESEASESEESESEDSDSEEESDSEPEPEVSIVCRPTQEDRILGHSLLGFRTINLSRATMTRPRRQTWNRA